MKEYKITDIKKKLKRAGKTKKKFDNPKCIHGLEYCAICKYGDGKKIPLNDNL